MAFAPSQITKWESEASSLKTRAFTVLGKANTDFTSKTEGQQVLNEATQVNKDSKEFLSRPEVRAAEEDVVYGERTRAAVGDAREAKTLSQISIDTSRDKLTVFNEVEPREEVDTTSSGATVTEDAKGRVNNATIFTPQGPALIPSLLVSDNPPITDGIPNILTGSNPTPNVSFGFENPGGAGVFLPSGNSDINDDKGGRMTGPSPGTATAGTANNTAEAGQLNTVSYPGAFEQKIQTTANPLSGLASYTYQISIYLMTLEQFTQMTNLETKSVANLSLLIQSGGGSNDNPVELNGAIRNPYFDLDYYIEDLEMESLLPRVVMGATNQTRLNFKIIEPYGFTFIQRLKKAVQDFFGTTDFLKQHYLMTIRFKGYDEDGNEVRAEADNNRSSTSSINEKFIPFKFSNITTKASTGAVEYMCEALPVNHIEALSQKRASIPLQVEIKGQTLKQLFGGPNVVETVAVNAGATQRVISTGLFEALNQQQDEYVRTGAIKIADHYSITFEGDSIGKQKVMPPGSVAKKRTASVDPTVPKHLVSANTQVEKETYTISVVAGQQLQQTIDNIIKTSQYITGQQKVIYDVAKGKWVSTGPEGATKKVLAWYKITSKVTPIGYDTIRKDYAYNIEFIVSPQQVTDVKSVAFPKDKFRGVHKKYNYWFTGENTEVLDYEVEFNALFYTSLSPKFSNEPDKVAQAEREDAEYEASKQVQPADQSRQNGADESADEAARAASVLYSPVDFARMEMTVLGDPDFIQQGDIFYRAGKTYDAFLEDGSVNYDSQEVFVEVNYRTIEDYNDETGEATPRDILLKSTNQFALTNTNGLIYQIVSVRNKFIKGEFTQELEGLMVEYPTGNVGVGNVDITKPKKDKAPFKPYPVYNIPPEA